MFKIQALVDFVVHVLNAIYGVVGNYGIAIIIVTILMRIIVFPLTLKQEKSMKKMRELQPELEKIKEKGSSSGFIVYLCLRSRKWNVSKLFSE